MNILNITRYSIREKSLTPWVKFIWKLEAVHADMHYKLLPTDCIDIILNLSDKIVYDTESGIITAPPFHINGLRGTPSCIHQEHSICVFGISFYAYGLSPFIRETMAHLQNKIVDLYDISPHLGQSFHRCTCCYRRRPDETIAQALEHTLLEKLNEDGNQRYMEKTILMQDFLLSDENITVRDFCTDHSINVKTFERMFLYHTGFTPLSLRNIRRFQNAGNHISRKSSTSLADIAYDNGYTDQAHFNREFRRYTGVSPRTFMSEHRSVKENAIYAYQ